jgi:2-hydroxychromene-2-carboxylate isomerase
VAAGKQNHLWDVVHGLFTRQGGENAGWVSDPLITEVVAGVPGLDGATLLEARSGHALVQRIEHAAHLAQEAGVRGTPTFQVGPTGGRLDLVDVSSLDASGLIPAIEAVLAR